MFKSRHHKIASLLAVGSFPVMVLFQNCGQNGSIEVKGGSLSGLAATENQAIQQLEDDLDVSDSQSPVLVQAPVVVQAPAVVQSPVVVQAPGVEQAPVTQVVSADVSMPQAPVQQPVVVVQAPVQMPEQQAPAQPIPTQVADNNDGSEDEVDPIPEQEEVVQTQECRNVEVADIMLKIKAVSSSSLASQGQQKLSFEIIDAAQFITLEKKTLRVRALKSEKVKQVFVELHEDGNQVLSMSNEVHFLTTPSAQQSGLKLQLSSEMSVKAGQEYDLNFEIKAEDQIVSNPVKCLLKPVIHNASLVISNSTLAQK